MKKTEKFYITTTLPYVNARPHVGHALEFIQADVISRYFKQKLGQDNVFFNLGMDEHGLKILQKAQSANTPVTKYVDEYAEKWKEFCDLFCIDYSNFYRTTSSEHHKLVKKFWKEVDANGYIYKKKYKGLYCVGCESFKTEKDLVDGKCPDHNKKPVDFEEENYFFKLSAFTDDILKYLEKINPEFVKPQNKHKSLINFVKDGLQDISISRLKENLPWGIEVPDDPSQVVYVWFDALTNYIFAVGYGTDQDKFQNHWPGIQLCGPDNLRFQGAIWQGMLAAIGLPFTKKLLVHGMVLAEDGKKMSKTIGNVVDPQDLADKYGVEAVRYYFAAGVPTFDDFGLSEARLQAIYNDHLADKFGNLLNRVIHLANSKEIDINSDSATASDFIEKVDKFIEDYENLMNIYELNQAYEKIAELTAYGNQYITDEAPWDKSVSIDKASEILQNLGYLLRAAAKCYLPVIPESAEKALNLLNSQEKGILFKKPDL
ncbi:methionine--tRNA ligase [Candidatus Dojkabacteria bacterium]|nr:methionine--tRNA ligase [Candidatus Dojkabacteria bacterium]